MPHVNFEVNGKQFSIARKGLYEIVEVEKLKPALKAEILAGKKDLVIAMFLEDSLHRNHEELAEDLGVTPNQIRMMRFHMGKESREPSKEKIEMLFEYYFPKILK